MISKFKGDFYVRNKQKKHFALSSLSPQLHLRLIPELFPLAVDGISQVQYTCFSQWGAPNPLRTAAIYSLQLQKSN